MTTRQGIAAICLLALGLVAPREMGAKPPAQFIWLSDLHFDPTANPKLVDALAEASVEEWPRILTSSPPASFSRFAEDSNWTLLSSSFDAVQKVASDAQFTLVTGDILVHRFREKFDHAATNHDTASFRKFVRKALDFVAVQLATVAPGKPVLFTLGNNDSECGDYQVQPGGAFLRDARPAVMKLLGDLADETSSRDWTALGHYSVRHPSLEHVRVISVNSIYFAPRYKDACSTGESDPARSEMSWLAGKLAEAKAHREKVWLMFHIPPGIDGYATSHPRPAGSPNKTVWMWKPEYTEQFERLLVQYRDTVQISLAGHEHMDDFRLLANSLVLMAPGISPVVGQNPAFRVAAFRPDGEITDQSTYYLTNLDQTAKGQSPAWKAEYSFASTWHMKRLNYKSFTKLSGEVERNPAARDRWSTLYSVSHPGGSNPTKATFSWLFCASGNITETAYQSCVKRIESASH